MQTSPVSFDLYGDERSQEKCKYQGQNEFTGVFDLDRLSYFLLYGASDVQLQDNQTLIQIKESKRLKLSIGNLLQISDAPFCCETKDGYIFKNEVH